MIVKKCHHSEKYGHLCTFKGLLLTVRVAQSQTGPFPLAPFPPSPLKIKEDIITRHQTTNPCLFTNKCQIYLVSYSHGFIRTVEENKVAHNSDQLRLTKKRNAAKQAWG